MVQQKPPRELTEEEKLTRVQLFSKAMTLSAEGLNINKMDDGKILRSRGKWVCRDGLLPESVACRLSRH